MHDGIGHMVPPSRHPPADTPPGADTPPRRRQPPKEQTPPGADTPALNMVNERAVRILLECILVIRRFIHSVYPYLAAWLIAS